MNYLAHLALAQPHPEFRLGCLMGDFRKHLDEKSLPLTVRQGICEHLLVDRYTDNHDRVRELKQLFSPSRRRFAGIILDVTFDHFLIRHWQRYWQSSRECVVDSIYHDMNQQRALMPRPMRQVVERMIASDWLSSYESLEGVGVALDRMSVRIRFKNKLHGAREELERHYEALDRGFLDFFPQLLQYTREQRPEVI